MDNPLADAETFITDNSNYIKELGQKPQDYNQIQAQFIGLIKISKDYATSILMHWKQLVLSNDKNAKNMYMTDFIQLLIDEGIRARASYIDNSWAEIDTPTDIDAAKYFWSPAK